ncbi:serine/threonine-protein kinase [Mycolicibacterium sediminis]|uniref:non-specific serine/threonine protein kinase n=1 Tax=Mycolicibacterium sediminis TaxID=1286180 RepID=A0A7I7QZ24_9MYCO|nr:protein kinase [Mycolicibacterium sediminis]
MLDDRHHGEGDLDRLHREFDFARRVAHPHVVTMYDRGADWVSMEVIGGGTVAGLTTTADVLAALAAVADALDHAHRLGVVHCDVKPSNILVRDKPDGGAVLVDFGVAHSSTAADDRRATRIEASLPYTAPEILHGRSPVAASDEYSLACTTVELLIGAPPFTAHTAMALIDAHLHAPVPRYARRVAWVSHAFDSILAKAMAKDPDLRYPTCSEFVQLATRALTGRNIA